MINCEKVINKPTLPFPIILEKTKFWNKMPQLTTATVDAKRRESIKLWPAVDAPQSTAGQPLVICLPPRH